MYTCMHHAHRPSRKALKPFLNNQKWPFQLPSRGNCAKKMKMLMKTIPTSHILMTTQADPIDKSAFAFTNTSEMLTCESFIHNSNILFINKHMFSIIVCLFIITIDNNFFFSLAFKSNQQQQYIIITI